MLNLNPGQYDALEGVATRWQNEDQSIPGTLGFSDYQARQSFVYGKAKKDAEDAARNGFNPDSAAKQAAEIGKAKAALRDCIENKADHHDAVYRGDIGFISFLYGQEQDDANGKAYGLSHLSFKHGDDGIIDRFADVLIRERAKKVAHNRIRIDKGQCTIYLCKILSRKNWGYTNHERWVMTAFTQDPDWGKKEKKGGA